MQFRATGVGKISVSKRDLLLNPVTRYCDFVFNIGNAVVTRDLSKHR